MTTPSIPGGASIAAEPAVSGGVQRTIAREPIAELYQRFLVAFNTGDYVTIAGLLTPGFTDHHPGFGAGSADEYLGQLRGARESLRLSGEVEDILVSGDHITTRIRLRGTHVGAVMGVPPTGRHVEWSTIEIWRASDGRFAERWAQDDLLGLREQLTHDAENIALITRLNDIVNARDYDAMDELFSPSFIDNNPAWSVRNLDELKGVIRSAKDALDFTSHHDQIYAADGGKVVIHITFSGRHVGTIFGQGPTDRPVRWTSIEIYRISNGKIAERWVQADTTGLMREVGVTLPQ